MNQRTELLPGVFLRVVPADKFKTACFSVNFLQPITRANAPLNALLPSVLLRGTQSHGDIQKISQHLDELYGASFGTLVRKKGDVITCGFFADFIEDDFAPDGTKVFSAMVDFLQEVLFAPQLDENGLFLPAFVEGEKQNLINAIQARLNDKRSYCVSQMLAAMCQGDPYGVPRLGDEQTAVKITPRHLMNYYRHILKTAQVEIFYMGRMPEDVVCAAMRSALQDLPQRRIIPIGVSQLQPSPEVKHVTEQLDVTQGKLCLGLRTNCGASDVNYPALQMLNVIYGSGISSKLFLHVREELSLCYYASSSLERFKGIMIVSSGIDCAQEETARQAILRQLEACKAGEITWQELETARRYLISAWKSSLDAPGRIDDFYLGQTVCGDATSIEERMQALDKVTLKDVIAAANQITLDTVYFLKGADIC